MLDDRVVTAESLHHVGRIVVLSKICDAFVGDAACRYLLTEATGLVSKESGCKIAQD
jgi:hypothetical protein